MADSEKPYTISERLLRLSTPRQHSPNATLNGTMTTADGSQRPASRRLNPEEQEKSSTRLTSPIRKTRTLPPLCKNQRKLTTEEEERSAQRLYKECVDIAKKKLEISEQRAHKGDAAETKLIPEEEISDMVNRLYTQSMATRQKAMGALKKKYTADHAPAHHHSSSSAAAAASAGDANGGLSSEGVAAMAVRLSVESPTKQRESKGKLFEKYVLSRQVRGAPRSQEEIEEAAQRLYRNEK